MFTENDPTFSKWKWQLIKPGGVKITPRCGMGIAAGSSNKAYAFGGVYDTEEDEENISGTYLNDFYILDTEKYSWRTGMFDELSH